MPSRVRLPPLGVAQSCVAQSMGCGSNVTGFSHGDFTYTTGAFTPSCGPSRASPMPGAQPTPPAAAVQSPQGSGGPGFLGSRLPNGLPTLSPVGGFPAVRAPPSGGFGGGGSATLLQQGASASGIHQAISSSPVGALSGQNDLPTSTGSASQNSRGEVRNISIPNLGSPQAGMPHSCASPVAGSSPLPSLLPFSTGDPGNLSKRSARDVSAGSAAREHQKLAAQLGYPIGPLQCTDRQLGDTLSEICTDCSTQGGGWGIWPNAIKRAANGSIGAVRGAKCCQASKNGCKWRIEYEFAHEGWVLKSLSATHSHNLDHSKAQVMATAAGRHMPDEYENLASLLARSNLGAAAICRVLQTKADDEGRDISWTRDDIYQKFKRSQLSTADASGLAELLLKRLMETGLRFFIESDEAASLSRIFVEMPEASQVWQGQVLLLDATHGTNQYGMKLSLFVTVDGHGRSVILAFTVHHSESTDDFFWAYKCFHECFPMAPTTFFTDSGAGLLAAFEHFSASGMPWASVSHCLCIFHIDKNFYDHIHCLFKDRPREWRIIHNEFWVAAKESDSKRQKIADAHLSEMRRYIEQHGSGSSKGKALTWFDTVFSKRHHQWMACFTWQHFSMNVHSTQRSESMFSATKKCVAANATLVKLYETLTKFVTDASCQTALQREKAFLHLQKASTPTLPTWITDLVKVLTPYGYSLLVAQVNQIMRYEVEMMLEAIQGDDDSVNSSSGDKYRVYVAGTEVSKSPEASFKANDRTVMEACCASDYGVGDDVRYRIVSADGCSCQLLECQGMVCRHQMAVRFKHPGSMICRSLVSQIHPIFKVGPYREGPSQPLPPQQVPVPVHTTTMPNAVPRRTATAAPLPSPTSSLPTMCFNGLQLMLKRGFTPVALSVEQALSVIPTQTPPHFQQPPPSFICMKWGRRDLGGWHIARVLPLEPGDDRQWNCRVFTPFTDQQVVCARLSPMQLVNIATILPNVTFTNLSWFKVVMNHPATPSSSTVAGLQNPTTGGGVGRPQTKRFKPGHGPMS